MNINKTKNKTNKRVTIISAIQGMLFILAIGLAGGIEFAKTGLEELTNFIAAIVCYGTIWLLNEFKKEIKKNSTKAIKVERGGMENDCIRANYISI